MLHGWLNEPGVVRVWEGEDVSWPAVIADYGSAAKRATLALEYPDFEFDEEEAEFDSDHVEVYVALRDGEPFGWIQCYAISDFIDHDEVKAWLQLGFDEAGAGIDYLVGNPELRGAGLGSSMIRHFVDEIVFGQHPDWTQVGASPVHANPASWGALRSSGHSLLGSFEDPEHGQCDLYARRRETSS